MEEAGFRCGRNSAKESLEILARALEAVACKPGSGRRDFYGDIAAKAIADVKQRGDWPLEEK
jgi:hypothetical protein